MTKRRGGGCRQLGGVLWKNLLLKRASWVGTVFEVLVPVGMLSLTALLKDLSTQYDNPAISYTCGPARPFDTSQPALLPAPTLAWLGCFQKPDECPAGLEDTQGYYQLALPIAFPPPFDALFGQLYASIGSINFLSFTVGDTSGAWDGLELPVEDLDFSLANPSLSIAALMDRLLLNGVVLAVVPDSPEVAAFVEWLTGPDGQAP
eukprot:SAG22_NODE_206_length_15281_cov_6.078975_7_plen_205_part_00